MTLRERSPSGFTILEVTVVVLILTILAVVGFATLRSPSNTANDLEARTALDQSIKTVNSIAQQGEFVSYDLFITSQGLADRLEAAERAYDYAVDHGGTERVGATLDNNTVYLARMSLSGVCYIVRQAAGESLFWAASSFTDCDMTSIDPFLVWTDTPQDAKEAAAAAGRLGDVPFLCNDDHFVETDEDCNTGVLPPPVDDPLNPDDDNDGLLDVDEPGYNTDPFDADSDNDGVNDGDEVASCTDPTDADSDDDNASDGLEAAVGTDPCDPDSDGDGYSDGDEIFGESSNPPVQVPPAPPVDVVISGTTVTSDSNPNVAQTCSVSALLVLDESGSIGTNAQKVRDAAAAYITAAKDTDAKLGVIEFNSTARLVAPIVQVTDANLSQYINYLADTAGGFGDGYDPSEYSIASGGAGTNYDAALTLVRNIQITEPVDVVVFITDGEPTFHNTDQPGDAADPYYASVAYNYATWAGDYVTTDSRTIVRAVEEANTVKANGAHIVGIGIGSSFSGAGMDNLIAIAGTDVGTLGDFDARVDDVIVVNSFDNLAQALIEADVFGICGPSEPLDATSVPFDSDADDDGVSDGEGLAASNKEHCGKNGNGDTIGWEGDLTRGNGNCKGTSTGNDGESENPVVDPNDELLIDTFSRTGFVGGSNPEHTYDAGTKWLQVGAHGAQIYDGVVFSEDNSDPAVVKYNLDTAQAVTINLDLVPRGRFTPSPDLDFAAYAGIGTESGPSVEVGLQLNGSPVMPDWLVLRDLRSGTDTIVELPSKVDDYTPIDLRIVIVGKDVSAFIDGVELLVPTSAKLKGSDQWLWIQAPGYEDGLPGVDNIVVELLY